MPQFKALKPSNYIGLDGKPYSASPGEIITAETWPGYSFKPLEPAPPQPWTGYRLPNGLQSRSRLHVDHLPDGSGKFLPDGPGKFLPEHE
jgi:hypothetical protein